MRRATARSSQRLAAKIRVRRPLCFRGTQLGLVNRVSTEATNVPAIDMRAITQLAEIDESGDQFVAEIIKVFLADLGERVRAIGLQMRQNDLVGIAATAHAIKGGCGHFGASHLVELSQELEDRTKRDPTGDLQPAIDSMVAETERVRAALEAYQSEREPR
jgi:HPt (histidine-containing phosphotransfer) domain-containing protein